MRFIKRNKTHSVSVSCTLMPYQYRQKASLFQKIQNESLCSRNQDMSGPAYGKNQLNIARSTIGKLALPFSKEVDMQWIWKHRNPLRQHPFRL